jgi:hypothetical protein
MFVTVDFFEMLGWIALLGIFAWTFIKDSKGDKK